MLGYMSIIGQSDDMSEYVVGAWRGLQTLLVEAVCCTEMAAELGEHMSTAANHLRPIIQAQLAVELPPVRQKTRCARRSNVTTEFCIYCTI